MTINNVYKDWKEKEGFYKLLTEVVAGQLNQIIKSIGIQARVVSRTKDYESIIKKLYTNHRKVTFSDYTELNDKSAARVICRFNEDTKQIALAIRDNFKIIKEEDKKSILNFDQVGYKSLHFDVSLDKEKIHPEIFSQIGQLICEIQVRTLCEDTWAEIYHDIGYKPSNKISDEINRQLYCLAGLLEVADDCFSNLNNQINISTSLNADIILRTLESPFIKLFNKEYDSEFSFENIRFLLPLIKLKKPDAFRKDILDFIELNTEKISRIVKENDNEIEYNPYISQPEIFLIFYLIDDDLFSLKDKWEGDFDLKDLEKICLLWGISLDDFEPD